MCCSTQMSNSKFAEVVEWVAKKTTPIHDVLINSNLSSDDKLRLVLTFHDLKIKIYELAGVACSADGSQAIQYPQAAAYQYTAPSQVALPQPAPTLYSPIKCQYAPTLQSPYRQLQVVKKNDYGLDGFYDTCAPREQPKRHLEIENRIEKKAHSSEESIDGSKLITFGIGSVKYPDPKAITGFDTVCCDCGCPLSVELPNDPSINSFLTDEEKKEVLARSIKFEKRKKYTFSCAGFDQHLKGCARRCLRNAPKLPYLSTGHGREKISCLGISLYSISEKYDYDPVKAEILYSPPNSPFIFRIATVKQLRKAAIYCVRCGNVERDRARN